MLESDPASNETNKMCVLIADGDLNGGDNDIGSSRGIEGVGPDCTVKDDSRGKTGQFGALISY